MPKQYLQEALRDPATDEARMKEKIQESEARREQITREVFGDHVSLN